MEHPLRTVTSDKSPLLALKFLICETKEASRGELAGATCPCTEIITLAVLDSEIGNDGMVTPLYLYPQKWLKEIYLTEESHRRGQSLC